MTDSDVLPGGAAGFLAALQLSDTALPIGLFVHSHGLESWLRDRELPSAETLAELLEATLSEAVATLDAVVLAHAYRAQTIDELKSLDALLTARKLAPSARHASQACGRKLASLARRLTPDRLVTEFAHALDARQSDGNLAVVQGTLARALGLTPSTAVLVELRGTAMTLLTAAIRLGALSPTDAQVILVRLTPTLTNAGATALALSLSELSATTPELEIAALAHARSDPRLFAS